MQARSVVMASLREFQRVGTGARSSRALPALPVRHRTVRWQVIRNDANQPQQPSTAPSHPAPSSIISASAASWPARIASFAQKLHQRKPDVKVTATGGGDGGSSGSGNDGGKGGGGGGDGNNNDGPGNHDNKENDTILSLKDVEAFCQDKKITLPSDMLEIAAKYGLRLSVLNAFVAAQSGFLSGFVCRTIPYLRDRLLADDKFLFKVGVEVLIDSGCATVAEVRKRGDDFWSEFDFYLSDLFVGLVLDVALVSLMAPAAVLGGVSKASMATGWLAKSLANVPSAFFEASVPGVKSYGVGQRFACLLVKFCEYSLAGITCGLIGQGICNSIMMLKRSIHGEKEDDVPVPPLFKTALVWGLFMGVSSNLRYQAVFGIERLVDSTIAKSVPAVAYGSTVAVRFVNNVIGGENFIDMARWAGVQ